MATGAEVTGLGAEATGPEDPATGSGPQISAQSFCGSYIEKFGRLEIEEPMLRAVRRYCLEHGTDGQVSLENRMACGVGACLGCVGKTTAGEYVQSCVHGPVFDVRDIDLEA